MAHYLITGGAGFIGSHLAERLLATGHSVVSLDNLDPFYAPALKRANLAAVEATARRTGARFTDVRGDIRRPGDVRRALAVSACDGVFHLAAKAGVRPSIEDPVGYWDVNGTGTAVVLEAARASGVRDIVFASSSSVYGNCPQAPFAEDMDVNTPISPYAATKRAGELHCHTMSHLHGLHVVCLRFFTVYGPRQRPDLAIRKFSELILAGRPIPFFGDGTTERDYTYITDILDGVVAAMDYARDGAFDVFNLGESRRIALGELVDLLGRVLGATPALDRRPMQPGDVQRTWADVTRAREKLGYRPKVGKEEGLRLFARWLREGGSDTAVGSSGGS